MARTWHDFVAAYQRMLARERRWHEGGCLGVAGLIFAGMLVSLGVVGLVVGVWLLLFPDDEVAEHLADDGVATTASVCERHLTYDSRGAVGNPKVENGNWIYDRVRVTFDVDGSPVTAELARLNEHSNDLYGYQEKGWQEIPSSADYACPVDIVHDPDDPTVVMATDDVDYYAGDEDRNDRFVLLGLMVLLLLPSVPWLRWFLKPTGETLPGRENLPTNDRRGTA